MARPSASRVLTYFMGLPAIASILGFFVGPTNNMGNIVQPTVSRATYLRTFLALLGLTLLTTLLGFLDLGSFNTAVAVFLAAVKACLIAAFFMHALHESRTTRVVMMAGVVWFLIMLSLSLVDFMSRSW